ncbi:MAG: hypothetical protein ACI93E_000593, partial [Flavobacteriales bacterium]
AQKNFVDEGRADSPSAGSHQWIFHVDFDFGSRSKHPIHKPNHCDYKLPSDFFW